MSNASFFHTNINRCANEYVDNLKPEFKNDPIIAGMVKEAFIAGRYNPANELAELQAKITSSELQVGKTAKQVPVNSLRNWVCEGCNYMDAPIDATFCPGCGARIVSVDDITNTNT